MVLLGRIRSLGLAVPRDLVAGAEAALQDRSLDAVSGGQRQLVFLAQAIFRAPRALMLDEPTASLDLRHQLSVLETVRAHARTQTVPVMIAMHDLSLAAQFAEQVICLADGAVDTCGSAAEVMEVARLRRLYGVETEIARSESGHLRIAPLRAIQG
ncbi:MAG: ABC transporter ATP-binding protein [Kiloniellales bacterium]|nr:ABC transporter ATP-binding protein [Kiloniellales bacterium]